jgi:hypothetical protein
VSRPGDVATAARNNAAWCDTVCATHGNPGVFSPGAWTTARRSPPLYPDAVTLDPAVTADEVLQRVDADAGCSVKDSFATLDLAPHGFGVLFEAEWIQLRARSVPAAGNRARWQKVRGAHELDEWAVAWAAPGAASPFRSELLREADVAIVAGRDATGVVAGAVLNRAAGAVGLTNLFSTTGDLDGALRAAVATATELFPNVAIVGYESGADLDVACEHGFVTLGPLRVWTKDAP